MRLLITIGRTLPNVIEVEAYAGALTGIEPVKTAAAGKGPRWFDRVMRGIRLKDGTGYAVEGDLHPDPMAEAVRWQICEGELVQAIGRARGVNRTACDPARRSTSWPTWCCRSPLTGGALGAGAGRRRGRDAGRGHRGSTARPTWRRRGRRCGRPRRRPEIG